MSYKMFKKRIVGMANFPEVNKYWVILACEHKVLCDHSIESPTSHTDKIKCEQCEKEFYGE